MKVDWVEFTPHKTFIKVNTNKNSRYTWQVPGFKKKLLKLLPGLKYHKCFNPRNLSFVDELDDTSIAHAFEHILIELISNKTKNETKIKAFTSWNWLENPDGIYQIKLHANNKKVIFESLDEAILIIDFCLTTPSA
jgi:hypothetical protein